jgi:hypothetical protein
MYQIASVKYKRSDTKMRKLLVSLMCVTGMVSLSHAGYQVLQDESGNPVTVTGNKLDVNATITSADVTGSTVTVSNFPATQNVSGTVSVTGSTVSITEPVTVDGSVTANVTGSTVNVVSPVAVTDNGGSLTVDGAVTVSGTADVTGSTVSITEPVTVDGSVTANVTGSTVNINGTVPVSVAQPVVTVSTANATAVVTRVATAATVTTLASANPARIKMLITNELGTTLIKLGLGAATTDYTYYRDSRGTVEIPDGYTGAVSAIRTSGSGNVQVTEY